MAGPGEANRSLTNQKRALHDREWALESGRSQRLIDKDMDCAVAFLVLCACCHRIIARLYFEFIILFDYRYGNLVIIHSLPVKFRMGRNVPGYRYVGPGRDRL